MSQQLVQKLWNYPPALSYGGTGCNILPSPLRYDATSRTF